MQAVVSKTRLPAIAASSSTRGLLLRADPRVEVLGAVDRHAQQHLGVLRSAVLRALAEKDARCAAGSIHISLTRFGIRSVLPASCGIQKLWSVSADSSFRNVGVGCARIAHRNVQLVGGDDAELGIAELPPELMPDDGDFDSAVGGFGAS